MNDDLENIRQQLASKIDAGLEKICIDDLRELFRQGVLVIRKIPTSFHYDATKNPHEIQATSAARLDWIGRERIEQLQAALKVALSCLEKLNEEHDGKDFLIKDTLVKLKEMFRGLDEP